MASQAVLKDRFATVQLTLLSVVVALILESLLGTLFSMQEWGVMVGVQALDILVSALAMWVGFAYGISATDKQPHALDFLGPFGLLIFLNLSIRFMDTGQLTAYFFSSALGSLTAAASLWLDCHGARKLGQVGPVTSMRLLMGIALWEALIGVLVALSLVGAEFAIAMLAVATLLQAIGVAKSINWWRKSLVVEQQLTAK